jgi:hypothetical protein
MTIMDIIGGRDNVNGKAILKELPFLCNCDVKVSLNKNIFLFSQESGNYIFLVKSLTVRERSQCMRMQFLATAHLDISV